MTKPLPRFTFDRRKVERELAAFDELLGEGESKDLEEKADILPFFKKNANLAALIGSAHPRIILPDLMKPEYGVVGAHVCDLVIGQAAANAFCVVEFEDAKKTSIFKAQRGDRLPTWSQRLKDGFDQILDWMCALDGIRHSDLFRHAFGSSLANFCGLLVVGRRGRLTVPLRERLLWRSQKVQVDGSPVTIMTYDDLRDQLALRAGVLT